MTLRDLRFGMMLLLRQPGFALPAIAALALGIGATSAIFSLVRAVLLDPIGMREPERIVMLWATDPNRSRQDVEVSFHNFREWQKQTSSLDGVALLSSVNLDFPITGSGDPVQVNGATVSRSFFDVLGVQPAAGRFFTVEEDRPGAAPVAVISDGLWKRLFGADPRIIGQKIRMEDNLVTIVGVTPPSFDFPREIDLFVPLMSAFPTVEKQPHFRVFRAVARLRDGVSVERATAELNVAAAQSDHGLPAEFRGYRVRAVPVLDAIFGKSRLALWVLFGAVILVLLIACANVANLLLARASARQREIAIRSALGADRARIVRQLLAESLLLAIAGAAVGFVLLQGATSAFVRFAPAEIPRMDSVRIDGLVVGFTAVLSLVTVVVFGLAPALHASRVDLSTSLKETGTSAGSRRRAHRDWLIAAEVAVSAMLLIAAGLLLRSFDALTRIDPGFRADNVLTVRLTLLGRHQTQEKRRAFYNAFLERVRALPGVESAGAVLLRPLSGTVGWDNWFTIEGQNADQQASNPPANYEAISPGYFRTMRIRIVDGRDFTGADVEGAQPVVILNESAARRYWPNQNAIGRRLKLGKAAQNAPWLTVVGVVADVRYREWESARVDLYVPLMQRAQHRSDFVIRTAIPPATLIPAVREALAGIDKDQAASYVTTMDKLVEQALGAQRFQSALLAAFAALALLLSMIGLYGVLSYSVGQRTREIGIRMAIGAGRGAVVHMVAAQAGRLIVAGFAAGLAAAVILTRLIESLLYGVSRLDPLTYGFAAAAVGTVAALACVIPALRASRIDPVRALRVE